VSNVFHSYETPELLMAQKSATCKIGPSDLVPLEKTPSALRDGLQSPPVSSPSVLARAPAWAIGTEGWQTSSMFSCSSRFPVGTDQHYSNIGIHRQEPSVRLTIPFANGSSV